MEGERTSDSILKNLTELVASRKIIDRDIWLEAAFDLTLFRIEEAQLLNKMRQAVAEKKLEILKTQTKRSVASAEIEIEATDDYRLMKDQEDKIYSIDELVRVAKKNAETNF